MVARGGGRVRIRCKKCGAILIENGKPRHLTFERSYNLKVNDNWELDVESSVVGMCDQCGHRIEATK